MYPLTHGSCSPYDLYLRKVSALNQSDRPLKNTCGRGAEYPLWDSFSLTVNVLPHGRIVLLFPYGLKCDCVAHFSQGNVKGSGMCHLHVEAWKVCVCIAPLSFPSTQSPTHSVRPNSSNASLVKISPRLRLSALICCSNNCLHTGLSLAIPPNSNKTFALWVSPGQRQCLPHLDASCDLHRG